MLRRSNKTALALAKNFFFGNFGLTLLAVAIFALLYMLGNLFLPIGIILIFGMLILFYSALFYYSKQIPTIDSPEQMEEVALSTTLGKLFFDRIAEGTALFLAVLTALAIFSIISYLVLTAMIGSEIDTLQSLAAQLEQSDDPQQIELYFGQLMQLLFSPMLIIFLIGSFFAYVSIGVYGRMLKGEGFLEVYRRYFLLFWPKYWLGTFRWSYFLLVSGWMIIAFLITFVAYILFYIIFLGIGFALQQHPGAMVVLLALIGTLFNQLLSYFIGLYTAAVSIFADDIASGEVDG